MSLKNYMSFIVGIYIAVVVWWFSLFVSGTKDVEIINIFNLFWCVIGPIFGILSFITFYKVRRLTREFKLFISVMFVIVGFLLWTTGNIIWMFYNIFLKIDVPFPSHSDLLFLSSYPFIFLGFLGFSLNVNRYLVNKIIIFRVLISLIIYFLLLTLVLIFSKDVVLTKFMLNTIYVIFDVLIIGISCIPWINLFFFSKGILIDDSIILPYLILQMAIIIELLADMGFFLQTMTNVYVNGGVIDLLFLLFNFLLNLSFLIFKHKLYPPLNGTDLTEGPHFIVQIPYLKQISLNCRDKELLFTLLIFLPFLIFSFKLVLS